MDNNGKLITLKEASMLTGYSADYIGQLIRSGKIPGKQVYSNITWMTTEENILSYERRKTGQSGNKASIKDFFINQKRKIKLELDLIMLFFRTFKLSLSTLLIFFIGFIISVIFLFYSFNGNGVKDIDVITGGQDILTY